MMKLNKVSLNKEISNSKYSKYVEYFLKLNDNILVDISLFDLPFPIIDFRDSNFSFKRYVKKFCDSKTLLKERPTYLGNKEISLDRIIICQPFILVGAVKKYFSQDKIKPINVLEPISDLYILCDGTHRVISRILLKKEKIMAGIYPTPPSLRI